PPRRELVHGRPAQPPLEVAQPLGPRADAPERQPGLTHAPALRVEDEDDSHAEGRALVHAELEVRTGPLARRGSYPHRGQDLVVPSDRLVRTPDELVERHLALAFAAPETDPGI